MKTIRHIIITETVYILWLTQRSWHGVDAYMHALRTQRHVLWSISQILKWCNADVLSSFVPNMFENSLMVNSLYFGGFCSDRSSLMGPYTRGFAFMMLLKKHGTEIRGSAAPFATTLCSTLMNLSLLISCTIKDDQVTRSMHDL